MAIADTVIPHIEVSTAPSLKKLAIQASEYTSAVDHIQTLIPKDADSTTIQRYLQENASSTPGFQESIHRQLGHYIRQDAIRGIRVILSALK